MKVALDAKYLKKVPHNDKNGNIYCKAQQYLDGVGVYSKEYNEELRALNEKFGGGYRSEISKDK